MNYTKRISILLIWLCSSISLIAQDIHHTLRVHTFTLDNGLTVYLNRDTYQKKVFGGIVVNAGSKNDPADATGIAHYLEHLLFKGTEQMGTTNFAAEKPLLDSINILYDILATTKTVEERTSIQKQINGLATRASQYGLPNEFDNLLKSIGSKGVNAFTSDDITFYHNSFPPNEIAKWLDIYAHRFQNPVFRSFQSELEVVYEEKNRSMDDFTNRVFEEFNQEFFKQHPYGQQTTLGTVEHLKNPSLTKMYEFFNTYYVPNNMALILCGDIDTAIVAPMIREKFGKWQSKPLPKEATYTEVPFQGRELIKRRLTPVKVGIMGFRTLPTDHPDKDVLDVCNYLLSNEAETGLLDKLMLDNKLMYAELMDLDYEDLGGSILIFIPKIFRQRFGRAEKLVKREIERIQEGEFDEAFLEAAKLEVIRDFKLSLEDLDERGVALGFLHSSGEKWNDYLAYPERVKAISKADIQRVSKQYYGDDYLVLKSSMGSSKPEKLAKPGYKAVLPEEGQQSTYAQSFDAIKPPNNVKFEPGFVNFSEVEKVVELGSNTFLHRVWNFTNDIFSLKFRFGLGSFDDSKVKYAANYMNYIAPKGMTLDEFKQAFQKIGCTYEIYSTKSYTYVSVSGFDEHLEDALKLLDKLFQEPDPTQEGLKAMLNSVMTDRTISNRQPRFWGEALLKYAQFGEEAEYMRALSKGEIKKLDPAELTQLFQSTFKYTTDIFYTGQQEAKPVSAYLSRSFTLESETVPSKSPIILEGKIYEDNQVLFIHDKRAVQSQVFFYVHGNDFDKEDEPIIDAFNAYIGGGFSGIILQEIREYRSLAYSAGGGYRIPYQRGKRGHFSAYVGCQGDKTIEAIDVMQQILANMPEKRERMDMIRSNLRLKAAYYSPPLRDVLDMIQRAQARGYEKDPKYVKMEQYEGISFEDIQAFYKKHVQNRPIVITIVGDKNRVNVEALNEFGKLTIMKKDDIVKW